jgi:AraC family transcriptional regulator of adaptative response / DNA-3-methyladenine glycosylase II
MELDHAACHRAHASKDRRFDGWFFIAVASTKIYCRPICPARTPKPENCTFVRTPAEAEKMGYRPCLRCRPERAPVLADSTFAASVDATRAVALAAARCIENGELTGQSLEVIAEQLGVSSRHLRRVFTETWGVSPVEYAQTTRLLTAKRLLTDTSLDVGVIAHASGFSSVRRMNALFLERYRMAPTRVRHGRRAKDEIAVELAYHGAYDHAALMTFLGSRTWSGVESVVGGEYRRTLTDGSNVGWLAASFDAERPILHLRFSSSLGAGITQIIAATRRVFDLDVDMTTIDDRLRGIPEGSGKRLPGAYVPFEMLLRAIIGQQVSVAAARTVASRVAAQFGSQLTTPFPELNLVSPSPQTLAEATVADVQACGMPTKRAETIVQVAQAVANLEIDFSNRREAAKFLAVLRKIPGIGDWTVQYVAMRAFGWPDAFPESDLGIYKALDVRTPAEARAAAETYRPWRAYATIRLWSTL